MGSAPAFFGQGLGDDQALALMDAAWEAGLTHFDTADAYGGGRSERVIGTWIATRGVRPTITTKTYNPMTADGDHGLSPERIRRQFASSLDRLGVDSIELYLAHEFDPDVPLAEALAALSELPQARAHGVSNFSAAQLRAALATPTPPAAIQNSCSLLARADEAEVIPLCADAGVAYTVFSPLAGGWLTGKYGRHQPYPAGSRMTQRPEPYARLTTDATFDALEALQRLADGRGTSMAGTALAWLLADDRIAQIVIGPGRPEHLTPAAEALTHPLTDDERARLDDLFSPWRAS